MKDIALLHKKLDKAESEANSLEEALRLLEGEVDKWSTRRDELNGQGKEITGKIRRLRKQRDSYNRRVAELRSERRGLVAELKSRREEYAALKKDLIKLIGEVHRGEGEVKTLIERLEWRIQTNPLKKEERLKIISRIRELEEEGIIHGKASLLRERMKDTGLSIGALKLRIMAVGEQIGFNSERSQSYHEQMMEKVEELRRVRAEADSAHERFRDRLEQMREKRSNYLEAAENMRHLVSQMREIEERERSITLDAEMEAKLEAAEEKMREKKKMSFEEFKALMEKGAV